MLNWYGLFSSSLWVMGLALLLATLSWSLYVAAQTRRPWRTVLAGVGFIKTSAIGMALLLLGLTFRRGGPLWQAGLWLFLALLFLFVAWQSRETTDPVITLRQRLTGTHGLALGIILLGMLVASFYAVTIRPWMQPDEPRHYEVILHDVRLGRPGATDKDVNLDWEREIIADMESQSFWWYGYSLVGWDPEHLPESFEVIWDPIYSRAFYQLPLYYDLAGIFLYAWGDALTHAQGVILLRFFGIFWLGVGLAGIYAMGRLLFPRRPQIALTALTFAALWPAHLAANAAVNNDPMAEALVIWTTYFALRLLRDGPNFKSLTAFFLLTTLTIYTKRTGFSVLVLMLVLPGRGVLQIWRNAGRRARVAGGVLLAAGLAVIPLLLYVIKATGRYWLTTSQMQSLSSRRLWDLLTAAPLAKFAQSLYRTFWGWFGWLRVPLPAGLYWGGLLITLALALFLIRGYLQIFGKKTQPWQKMMLVVLLLALFTQIGLTLGKDIVYEAWRAGSVPQMRYLYPVFPAILIPAAAGLHFIIPQKRQRQLSSVLAVLLLLFNFYILAFILYPFFWL